MKKNIINYLFCLILLITSSTFTACSKWLDVSPKSDMKAEDLFANEAGFRDALIGVYALMTGEDSYGGALTMEISDILAQYYDSPARRTSGGYDSKYKYFALNDYKNADVEDRINKIWTRAFKSVANINLALEFIDINKSVFATEDRYNLHKGEFLALRALIHFDMLRFFAPSPKMDNGAGLTSLAIPYINSYTNIAKEQLTVEEVLKRCIDDLKQAKTIMVGSDPFGPKSETKRPEKDLPGGTSNEPNRIYRMNYYAVTAALARVYNYYGKKDLALGEAVEIIGEPNAESLPSFFTLATDNATTTNPMFASELIFALNKEKLKDANDKYYVESFESNTTILTVSGAGKNIAFGSADDDFRLPWFKGHSDGKSFLLKKYTSMVYIPMFKISELYLIAAECAEPSVGLNYLNKIRTHRGLAGISSVEQLDSEIYKEFKREFIGEGQLFHFYKRKVYAMIGFDDKVKVTDAKKVYILPIPLAEIDFGNIKN